MQSFVLSAIFTPFCFCFYFTSCLNLCKLTFRLLPEEEHSLALTQARVVALTQGSRWPFARSDNEHLMWDTLKAFSHHFWGEIAFTDNSQIKRGFRLGWGYIYVYSISGIANNKFARQTQYSG